ncbi:helix-turn-helix domain-containing protein [Tropicibacter naphthalenivorans]|uniref:Hydrogenase transcriptional regulatory protein hupR1 n=1 Tax=Tropicibacter naphthalenivorans TaxID=441103 RepID=A0A0P1GIQ0_9RHOB|nr:helix-turn-helix domain-containing protein [Tropicibacter naphthalenivorans]CUH81340.1 Hydrogenase transcriptional regulatory protein hupR1 [Tropicibacter naphthalenivorans]SMC98448.1 regulatory protein, Fis family [Tropicibacter naphthalenivorans]
MAKHYNRPAPEIEVNVADFLMEQRWPGNVRQLRHMVERAMVFADDGRLKVEDFQRGSGFGARKAPAQPAPAPAATAGATLKDSLDALEIKLINDAIIRFKGNKKKAAEHLGVSRSYLYKKLEAMDEAG